jgi:hypothetical protein
MVYVWQNHRKIESLQNEYFSMGTDLIHELSNNTVPLAGIEVVDSVLAVWHQLDAVFEADHGGNHSQQVNAKALVPLVPRQITLRAHHHVRRLLRFIASQTSTQHIRHYKDLAISTHKVTSGR